MNSCYQCWYCKNWITWGIYHQCQTTAAPVMVPMTINYPPTCTCSQEIKKLTQAITELTQRLAETKKPAKRKGER